jgi:glycerol-3-phosphate dehydrogenase
VPPGTVTGVPVRRRRTPPPAVPPRAFDRVANLARLAEGTFDVVVVGGGITGCGVALDAAARGLRTALVEAADFASGTSSKSSKLVHGGLRYLDQHEYRLVYEALAERQRLLDNAPHLVRPMPFLIPLFGRDGVVSAGLAKAYSTALWLYDLTGGLRIGRRHRRITAADALRHVPVLRTDRLVASFVYWDAQADDARLTLAVARTAAAHGATVVNRAPVAGLLSGAGGRVGGVRLSDGTEVKAHVVVNAGGVWSEQLGRLPGTPAGVPAVSLRPAKGVHVTVPADRLPCDYAVVLAVPGEKRSVFVAPWYAPGSLGPAGPGRFTYIGTTDTDYHGSLDGPACDGADIDGLLAAVNAWTTAGLTRADVTGTWVGLRPLLADAGSGRSADLSRRHQVVASPAGVVTVTGGKLTTYRRMAADTVDAVVALLSADGGGRPGRGVGGAQRSPTARLALVGAAGLDRVPVRGGVIGVPSTRRHLLGRYGDEAPAVAALCDADASLAGALVPGLPYLRAEAVWAARHEMAVTLDDVLSRRTRSLLLDREATAAAAPGVARLLAGELGWDEGRVEREVAAVVAIVGAERTAAGAEVGAGGVHGAPVEAAAAGGAAAVVTLRGAPARSPHGGPPA